MLVNGLVEKGFISKVTDPADSRVVLLALTPTGQKAQRDVTTMMDTMRDEILNAIDPERRAALLQSLDTLKNAMERVSEALE